MSTHRDLPRILSYSSHSEISKPDNPAYSMSKEINELLEVAVKERYQSVQNRLEGNCEEIIHVVHCNAFEAKKKR